VPQVGVPSGGGRTDTRELLNALHPFLTFFFPARLAAPCGQVAARRFLPETNTLLPVLTVGVA